MRVDLFDFELPSGHIAHEPAHPRDSAKLLHVDNELRDLTVRNLPELLSPGDVLVLNDSRVIPARLFAQVNDKQVEVLLHQPGNPSTHRGGDGRGAVANRSLSGKASHPVGPPPSLPPIGGGTEWLAFARPARKLKEGMPLHFAEGFTATVMGRTEDGQVKLEFPYDSITLFDKLRAHGHMPLPPYIAREDKKEDSQDYQTIYAAHDGSVAAPTAGLHFTPQLMAALKARGIHTAFVTLHVGAGTFQPVKVEDTDAHVMHREAIEIGAEAARMINDARAKGGKVIAVGTTSLRILESVSDETGHLEPYAGSTAIFITPGYRFKIVDKLMTNFHLPRSTLFMLVSAFAGRARMQAAYAHAIAHQYRFYSYGDTSLLERQSDCHPERSEGSPAE